MGTFYAYQRISTAEERGKQKFSRQDAALRRYCREQRIDFDFDHDVYRDDKSGKTFDGRIGWKALDKRVTEGDTIIFKDLQKYQIDFSYGLHGRRIAVTGIDGDVIPPVVYNIHDAADHLFIAAVLQIRSPKIHIENGVPCEADTLPL